MESIVVVLIGAFALDYAFLSDFIEDHREKFYRFIKVSPMGRKPRDSSLKTVYNILQQTKCCAIDDYHNMTSDEGKFFRTSIFAANCANRLMTTPLFKSL